MVLLWRLDRDGTRGPSLVCGIILSSSTTTTSTSSSSVVGKAKGLFDCNKPPIYTKLYNLAD